MNAQGPRNGRMLRASFLLDEIGNVDDRFIAEADTPYRPARRGFSPKRILILAATLCVSLSLLLCLFVGGMLSGLLGDKSGDGDMRDDAVNENGGMYGEPSDDSTAYRDLSSMLLSLKGRSEEVYDEAELSLTQSSPMIIWHYAEENGYRARSISRAECTRLMTVLSNGKETPVSPSDAAQAEVQVWIALGDGRIISPCLKQSEGNVSYGVLFEYDPEVEPSEDFITALYDTLS